MKYASLPGLNLWVAMKAMLKHYGHEFVDPPELNNEMMNWGTAHSAEYACLPYKVYYGFGYELAKRGVNRVMVFGCRSERACRYVDLCEGIAKAARDQGYPNFDVTYWGGYGLWKAILDFKREMGNPSWLKLLRGGILFGTVLTATDEMNDLANSARPREKISGAADAWLKKWWPRLGEARSRREAKRLLSQAKSEFAKIELDEDRPIVPVAFIGDLFKIHESFFHFDTIRKLNRLGLEVKQPQSFSLLFFGNLNLWSHAGHRKLFKYYQKRARKYLKSIPASYIDICIGEAIDLIEKGAKGIVHFQSFGCMPDIMLKPILDRVAQDYGVPIMHYLRDSQSSDGAYQTRLEAFADLVKKKN